MSQTNPRTEKPKYDLEERIYESARDARKFIKRLPRTICNIEDVRQLVRSSGSIAANYIEANEAISKKDFRHRIRIARKESKESILWLRLVDTEEMHDLERLRASLIQEARELMLILSAILRKSDGKEV